MSDGKLTLLLATALFLVSAPEPDSRTIAEMTANFIVPADERALQAAELPNPLPASESQIGESKDPAAAQEASGEAQQQPAPESAQNLR